MTNSELSGNIGFLFIVLSITIAVVSPFAYFAMKRFFKQKAGRDPDSYESQQNRLEEQWARFVDKYRSTKISWIRVKLSEISAYDNKDRETKIEELFRRAKTLDDAVNTLIAYIANDNELDMFRETEESVVLQKHPYFGRYIRNTFGLWDPESPLHKWFKDNLNLAHADDTSAIIIVAAHRLLNGKPSNEKEMADRFHTHWLTYGLNPDGTGK